MLDAKTAEIENPGHAYDNVGYQRFEMGEEVTMTDAGDTFTFYVGDLVEYDGDKGWISNLKELSGHTACFTQLNPWLAPEGHFAHGRFITTPRLVTVLDSPRLNATDEEVEEALRSIATVQTER